MGIVCNQAFRGNSPEMADVFAWVDCQNTARIRHPTTSKGCYFFSLVFRFCQDKRFLPIEIDKLYLPTETNQGYSWYKMVIPSSVSWLTNLIILFGMIIYIYQHILSHRILRIHLVKRNMFAIIKHIYQLWILSLAAEFCWYTIPIHPNY